MSGWMWVWASRLGSGMRWLPCACVPGPRAGWWASEVNQVWCFPPVLLQIALPANHTVIIPSCPKCCPCLSAAEVPRSSICCTVKSWDKWWSLQGFSNWGSKDPQHHSYLAWVGCWIRRFQGLLVNQTPSWVLAISILHKLPWGFLLCTKIWEPSNYKNTLHQKTSGVPFLTPTW